VGEVVEDLFYMLGNGRVLVIVILSEREGCWLGERDSSLALRMTTGREGDRYRRTDIDAG
jgi:hypothetical protein